MTLRGDDRAATVQIGAVLLFGFLVIAMSTYQVAVVPSENEAAELAHSEAVQTDLLTLQSAVHRAALTGGSHPTAVDLGVAYGSRTFFVNPPPAHSRLANRGGDATLTVSNAVAVDAETADYWNGTPRSFDSATFIHRPEYNEYRDAPTTVLETGVAYNRFGDAGPNRTLTDQTYVDGRHLSVVLRAGNVDLNGEGTRLVTPRAVSVATRSVTVEGGDGNVTLHIPTQLDATTWETLLRDEIDRSGTDDDKYVYDVRDATGGGVVVEMEAGTTYDLRVGRVALGSGESRPEPYYVTRVTGVLDVSEGGERTVVFEVRDRYDNPVPGAKVNVSLNRSTIDDARETLRAAGRSGETIRNLTAGEEGRLAVTYFAPTSVYRADRATVAARVVDPATDASPDARAATATFDVGHTAGDTYDLEWNLGAIEAQRGITGCDEATVTCTYNVSEDSDKKPKLVVESRGASFVDVDFSANDSAIITSFTPSSDETGGDGTTSTEATVDTAVTGTVKVFASAVEDSDVLRIRIV